MIALALPALCPAFTLVMQIVAAFRLALCAARSTILQHEARVVLTLAFLCPSLALLVAVHA